MELGWRLNRRTLDAVGVAQRVERVLAGAGGGRHVGDHHRARLLARERVAQHLRACACMRELIATGVQTQHAHIEGANTGHPCPIFL
jgi:hypothetical protein